MLPIWIGAVEATAIAFAEQGVQAPRPLTHDLLVDVIAALADQLTEIRIVELRDGIFYALLIMASGTQVSARPSDAIALALRTGAPVLVAEEVLDEAAVDATEDLSAPDSGVVADGADQTEEVERFREFLDKVTPDDFEQVQDPEEDV